MSPTESSSIATSAHAITNHVILTIEPHHSGRMIISATSPLTAYKNVELADLIVAALGIEPELESTQIYLVRVAVQVEVLEALQKAKTPDPGREIVDYVVPLDALETVTTTSSQLNSIS
jgi:protoporphyrinogen oxidase